VLIVVRHGRTEANARGLLLGRADPDLDAEGEAQAVAVAGWIGPVDRVVTSPLRRAVRTAAAFAGEVEVDDRWIELDYGTWDGRPVADIPADAWRRWRTDPDFAPPGGESHAALLARVVAAGTELVAEAAERDIVVVTHVSPIKAVVAWALDAGHASMARTRVGQPSVTRIAAGSHGPVLVTFNGVPPG